MRIVTKITDEKYLNIKKIVDEDKNTHGYLFAERLGVDSVAFICYDRDKEKFLINTEWTPPIDEFRYRAFGGSIDKDKPYWKIVQDETLEEAGYNVSGEEIYHVGEAFVSTQMNQTCYLFFVEVDDSMKVDRKPENAMEAMAEPIWKSERQIFDNDDWKAISIIVKAKRLGLV